MSILVSIKWSASHSPQNRLWQRDRRDSPVVQPDVSYYNEVGSVGLDWKHNPISRVGITARVVAGNASECRHD